MSAKLLTENQLEFLRLKGGCTGPSESTLVKIPHCWKLHVTAHIYLQISMNVLLGQTSVTAHLIVQTLLVVTPVHATLGTQQLMCMGNVEVSFENNESPHEKNSNVTDVCSKDAD